MEEIAKTQQSSVFLIFQLVSTLGFFLKKYCSILEEAPC